MKTNMDLFVTIIGQSLLLLVAIVVISTGLMNDDIISVLIGILVILVFVIHLNLDIHFIEFKEKKKKW